MEGCLPHEHGLSYKKMAEMTEGFNYDKLDKLTGLAAMMLKQRMKFLFGKDREQMVLARQQGLVFITEEMFHQMVKHLSIGICQTDMLQNFQMASATVPVKGTLPGNTVSGADMKSEWISAMRDGNSTTELHDTNSVTETELGQGRSMMDMMDDLDLDNL